MLGNLGFIGSDEINEQIDNLSQISRDDSVDYEDTQKSAAKKRKDNPKHHGPALPDERPKYAVKIIRARDEEYQCVALKEYHLLKRLNHDGVIKMQEAYINKSSHAIYLVMELVEGLPLKTYI